MHPQKKQHYGIRTCHGGELRHRLRIRGGTGAKRVRHPCRQQPRGPQPVCTSLPAAKFSKRQDYNPLRRPHRRGRTTTAARLLPRKRDRGGGAGQQRRDVLFRCGGRSPRQADGEDGDATQLRTRFAVRPLRGGDEGAPQRIYPQCQLHHGLYDLPHHCGLRGQQGVPTQVFKRIGIRVKPPRREGVRRLPGGGRYRPVQPLAQPAEMALPIRHYAQTPPGGTPWRARAL